MSKCFEFKVYMNGWGDTVEEAWENCQDHFMIEEEPLPLESLYEIIDEEDE